MKIISLALILTIGLIVGNLLAFQKACEAKPSAERIKSTQESTALKTPLPALSPSTVKWIPSEYMKITPGKSTEKDVEKILGKPKGESNPEGEKDLDEESPGSAILLEYSNGENESFDLVLNGKTKIVEYITVYNLVRPTRDEIISKYGGDYFEIESGESKCIAENRKRGASNKPPVNYPISLVYPEKGIAVPIDKDNKAVVISYSYKCDE